jgi:hypothetical protein
MHINETFDILGVGERIKAACFFDGAEDEYIIQFFRLSGSIIRACYNRHTTQTTRNFVPVNTWEFAELEAMYQKQIAG